MMDIIEQIFTRQKPYVIAVIPHYDDIKNVTKCYNTHLAKLCDRVIILYGRIENYPPISEEKEKEEETKIKEICDKNKIPTLFTRAKKVLKDKRQMMQILYQEAIKEAESAIQRKNLTRKIYSHTPIWVLRLDSDEEITKELYDELEILIQLDYIYNIFLKERHFVDGNHIIVGSGGWSIEGNKFIPRVMKIWDGKDLSIPTVPHHHSTTYAHLPRFGNTVPFASLPSITSSEVLHHWGHAKKKRKMNRKSKFYKKRGDLDMNINDNYVPINTKFEKRLRTWFKNHEFEGIMEFERGRKT